MGKQESIIWSIGKEDSSLISYIMGSMHTSNSDAYQFVEMAKGLIDRCHTYVAEINLNDPDLNNLAEIFLLKNGNLIDIIGEKKFQKARKIILKAFDIDIHNFLHLKPIVVSNMIAESVLTTEYDLALDHYLWTYATSRDKDMLGLESAQDQYHIMQQIDMEYQIKSLLDISKNVSKFRKSTLKLSKYYAQGELNQLYKSSKRSMGALRKLMIYNRNKHMLDNLLPIVSKRSCFIAVGAAHLPGNKGLLALLKKKGYKIKPINHD